MFVHLLLVCKGFFKKQICMIDFFDSIILWCGLVDRNDSDGNVHKSYSCRSLEFICLKENTCVTVMYWFYLCSAPELSFIYFNAT